jgi:hypothetical protein
MPFALDATTAALLALVLGWCDHGSVRGEPSRVQPARPDDETLGGPLRSYTLPLVTLLIAACGPSRADFVDEYIEALCEWAMDCQEEEGRIVYEDQEECEEFGGTIIDESDFDDCDYDKDAAKECIDAVRNLDCEPSDDFFEDMEVCDKVWTCPDDDDTGWDSGR